MMIVNVFLNLHLKNSPATFFLISLSSLQSSKIKLGLPQISCYLFNSSSRSFPVSLETLWWPWHHHISAMRRKRNSSVTLKRQISRTSKVMTFVIFRRWWRKKFPCSSNETWNIITAFNSRVPEHSLSSGQCNVWTEESLRPQRLLVDIPSHL